MKTYCLETWGDYACFTRPEMKTERVSYDVITPSAARAIFESILWKPAIQWKITKIEVLNPIRWISIRRNELKNKISYRIVQNAMDTNKGALGQFIEEERVQRNSLLLRDVHYRIYAHFEIIDHSENNSAGKFLDMFERRAEKGQCINQPYFGCREFAANFALLEKQNTEIEPIPENHELGWMLYDMDYTQKNPMPRFFKVQLINGVINIPDWTSAEVR